MFWFERWAAAAAAAAAAGVEVDARRKEAPGHHGVA